LNIFEFTKLEDLQIFIKRYIYFFTDDPGPGALLLLYSAVWTRGFQNTRADLDSTKGANLTGNYEEGSLNVVTLLLSGRATVRGPLFASSFLCTEVQPSFSSPICTMALSMLVTRTTTHCLNLGFCVDQGLVF
jgi:hypothetical protein